MSGAASKVGSAFFIHPCNCNIYYYNTQNPTQILTPKHSIKRDTNFKPFGLLFQQAFPPAFWVLSHCLNQKVRTKLSFFFFPLSIEIMLYICMFSLSFYASRSDVQVEFLYLLSCSNSRKFCLLLVHEILLAFCVLRSITLKAWYE